MSVHDRTYRGYQGPLTREWTRFLALPRYAYREIFASRFFILFFIACYGCPLVIAAILYVTHNKNMVETYHVPPFPISGASVLGFLGIQGGMAFLLTILVAPPLVARDLSNNALPLYLCRPFSRAEYVLGKMSVLAILLSLITWVPGLLLYLLKAHLAGGGWFYRNLDLAAAVFLGSWVWIIILSLVSLAISAYVKKAILSRGLLLIVFTVLGGFGNAINEIFHTNWGSLLNLVQLIGSTWTGLCGIEAPEIFLPPMRSTVALIILSGFCLYLLARKVRAYEVVK